MATLTFSLTDGLSLGAGDDAQVHYDCTLRELTAGDLIKARQASERIVEHHGRPVLVSSPELLALHVIRHQVQSIGDINGPLSVKNLESLSMRDLMLIEEKSNALEAAIFAEGLAKTGRA